MNTKKMVLILVSLVFLFAMCVGVSAFPTNLSVSNVTVYQYFTGPKIVLQNYSGGSYYLKSAIYNLELYLNNTDLSVNITDVNVTLPSGVTFVAGSNDTDSTAAEASFSNTTNKLIWSATAPDGLIANGSLTYKIFSFNVTVSSGSDGAKEIRIETKGLAPGGYNLTNNIVADTTAPTFVNATFG